MISVPPFQETPISEDENKVFITQAAHSVALDVVATVGFCTPRKNIVQGNTLRSGSSLAFHEFSHKVRIQPCSTPQIKLAATFFALELALPEIIFQPQSWNCECKVCRTFNQQLQVRVKDRRRQAYIKDTWQDVKGHESWKHLHRSVLDCSEWDKWAALLITWQLQ